MTIREKSWRAALAINNAALLAGDYNHDDRVDMADYVLWRNTMNSTSLLAADGSKNGVVDAADYNVWRSNFGLSFPASGSGLGSGSVPEPATLLMITIAAVGAAAIATTSLARTLWIVSQAFFDIQKPRREFDAPLFVRGVCRFTIRW